MGDGWCSFNLKSIKIQIKSKFSWQRQRIDMVRLNRTKIKTFGEKKCREYTSFDVSHTASYHQSAQRVRFYEESPIE